MESRYTEGDQAWSKEGYGIKNHILAKLSLTCALATHVEMSSRHQKGRDENRDRKINLRVWFWDLFQL